MRSGKMRFLCGIKGNKSPLIPLKRRIAIGDVELQVNILNYNIP